MSRSRPSVSRRRRLHTPIKIAALIAALAFVTVVLEQPRLTASPSRPRATAEQRLSPSRSASTFDAATDAAISEGLPAPVTHDPSPSPDLLRSIGDVEPPAF
jgi:hypothetical protein